MVRKVEIMIDRNMQSKNQCSYCKDGIYSNAAYDYCVRIIEIGNFCPKCGRPFAEVLKKQLENYTEGEQGEM